MKELMKTMINRDVDKKVTMNSWIIIDFRKQISFHFGRFVLTENTTKLARTASYLDPEHMVLYLCEDPDLKPFVDYLL